MASLLLRMIGQTNFISHSRSKPSMKKFVGAQHYNNVNRRYYGEENPVYFSLITPEESVMQWKSASPKFPRDNLKSLRYSRKVCPESITYSMWKVLCKGVSHIGE